MAQLKTKSAHFPARIQIVNHPNHVHESCCRCPDEWLLWLLSRFPKDSMGWDSNRVNLLPCVAAKCAISVPQTKTATLMVTVSLCFYWRPRRDLNTRPTD
ncbi:MAG: hypothetical protein HW380_3165 [Magnetococcales bacterium]|nr:hypothetical protein [Magnetococcales bacterium]